MTVGPLCRNGHERAVYERVYPRPGKRFGSRQCLGCAADRRLRNRQMIQTYAAPLSGAYASETELLSQDEMIRRIEAMRGAS